MVNTHTQKESAERIKGKFIKDDIHNTLGRLNDGEEAYINPKAIRLQNIDGIATIPTTTITSKKPNNQFSIHVKRTNDKLIVNLDPTLRFETKKSNNDNEKSIAIQIPEKNIYTS